MRNIENLKQFIKDTTVTYASASNKDFKITLTGEFKIHNYDTNEVFITDNMEVAINKYNDISSI